MYHYLIGYCAPSIGRFGAMRINLEKPVRGEADINYLTSVLREQGLPNPIVTAFSRFEEDEQ